MKNLAILLVLGGSLLSAQTGIVKFSDQPVPGATVIASEDGNRVVTTTDESGSYQLPNLPAGTYTIEVQMFGFQPARRQVRIGPGSAPIDRTLELQPRPREAAQRPESLQNGFRNLAQNETESPDLAAPPRSPARNRIRATKRSW